MLTFVVIVLLWTTVSLAVGGLWAWARWSRSPVLPTPAPVLSGPVPVPAPRAVTERPAQRV